MSVDDSMYLLILMLRWHLSRVGCFGLVDGATFLELRNSDPLVDVFGGFVKVSLRRC